MNRKFHGVFSLGLFALSIVAGLVSILGESMSMGILYAGIIFVAPQVVIYSFCSKCTCRLDGCGHVFPGKLTQCLPERKQGLYSFWDIFWTAVPLIVLFMFPQFWLWKNMVLAVIFWTSCVIGFFVLIIFVCRSCTNENCPVCNTMGREGN